MQQSVSATARPGTARPQLTPIGVANGVARGAVAHRKSLVAVIQTQPNLPSLAAARVAAVLRARGDEVRFVEFEGDGLLALPRLGLDADLVALVDADDEVRMFPANAAAVSDSAAPGLVPDFSDYPFARTRVLPIAAAAGGATRSLGAMLHEVREYARRYAMPDLVFIDRALNADHALFAGLIDAIQRHAPGVQWMAAVHVNHDESDALSRKTIRAAAASGVRSLVLRTEDERSADRARELATHAGDAGILTRIVAAAPLIEISRANVIAAIRGGSSHAFADIALKD